MTQFLRSDLLLAEAGKGAQLRGPSLTFFVFQHEAYLDGAFGVGDGAAAARRRPRGDSSGGGRRRAALALVEIMQCLIDASLADALLLDIA